jgi:predicted kinase
MKITLTQGLSGSGKSTWAKTAVKRDGNTVIVCKDDIRAMMGVSWNSKAEKLVIQFRDANVRTALNVGKSVIIADTNLHPKHAERMEEIAKEYKDVTVNIKSFLDVPIETCIKQDLLRLNSVGEAVIRRQWNDYLKWNEFLTGPIRTVNPDLPFGVICDLDGTLAGDISHRNPYDASTCIDDKVNPNVLEVLNYFKAQGNHIIFCSGRTSEFRPQTVEWLAQQGFAHGDYVLIMRRTGDQRKDSIVKREFLEDLILPSFNVKLVLDDRDQVVRMWREAGFECWQVAPGAF